MIIRAQSPSERRLRAREQTGSSLVHLLEAMQSGLLDLGMTNEDPVISHAEIFGAVTNTPVHPVPTHPTHFAKVRFDLEPESPTG
jgi:hypothetical protein